MSSCAPQAKSFNTATDASAYVAARIANAVRQAIATRGQANVCLSGGSTPRPAYEALSGFELPWHKTNLSLVDDRWVPETNPGSNAAMIRKSLLQGPAARARFIPLVSDHETPENGLAQSEQSIAPLMESLDICLMGMGTDGHTASWFPGSGGLAAALDIENTHSLAAIDAAGCIGASNYPARITLTFPAVMQSREIILFITGDEKARVLDDAKEKSVTDAPVKALLAAGNRLTIVSTK